MVYRLHMRNKVVEDGFFGMVFETVNLKALLETVSFLKKSVKEQMYTRRG